MITDGYLSRAVSRADVVVRSFARDEKDEVSPPAPVISALSFDTRARYSPSGEIAAASKSEGTTTDRTNLQEVLYE